MECPFKAKLKFIERRTEPGGPAMARGAEIHGLAQDFIEGRKRMVPADLSKVKAELTSLRKRKATSEGEIGLTSTWIATGWFDANVWCRVKLDAIAPIDKRGAKVEAIDWKTGRYAPDRPEYVEQLHLYATGVMSAKPLVNEVHAKLVFTDHDQRSARPVVAVYKRDALDAMQSDWEKRVKPLLNDTRFAPRPGAYCRYCAFRKAVGGPCKY